jgi:hypothetical protein
VKGLTRLRVATGRDAFLVTVCPGITTMMIGE